jgi:predicted cobalt transporter CbtA
LPTQGGVGALLPIVGGLAGLGLAAYQPKLAIGSGGLTLLIAATLKKGSMWWILGAIVLALGIFFLWIERNEELTPKSA